MTQTHTRTHTYTHNDITSILILVVFFLAIQACSYIYISNLVRSVSHALPTLFFFIFFFSKFSLSDLFLCSNHIYYIALFTIFLYISLSRSFVRSFYIYVYFNRLYVLLVQVVVVVVVVV